MCPSRNDLLDARDAVDVPSTLLSRREVLTAGLATCLGVSGCLSGLGPSNRAPDSSTRTRSSSPPVTAVSATSSATAETPVPTGTTRTPETRTEAPHVGDFKLWNDDTRPHVVVMEVHHDGETILDVQRSVDPGEAIRVENTIEQQGTYQIVVRLTDGSEHRARWTIESCSNHQYQQVYIGENAELAVRTMQETIDPDPTCDAATPPAETRDGSAP